LSTDDANRALMGANMQKQAVPLVVPEAPTSAPGVEARAARDAGDVVPLRRERALITEVSGDQIVIEYKSGRRTGSVTPSAAKFYRLGEVPPLQPEHLDQPEGAGRRGQKVANGDLLADGPSTHNGELALGKNLLVAFMPWEGYNYRGRHHPLPAPRARRRA